MAGVAVGATGIAGRRIVSVRDEDQSRETILVGGTAALRRPPLFFVAAHTPFLTSACAKWL
jgi:hypothetical protein